MNNNNISTVIARERALNCESQQERLEGECLLKQRIEQYRLLVEARTIAQSQTLTQREIEEARVFLR